MQFTVRDVLVLTFIAALVALSVGAYNRYQSKLLEMARTEQALLTAQTELEFAQQQADQARYLIDLVNTQIDAWQRAVDHFPVLQNKYGGVEPRGGEIVSTRPIPVIVDSEFDGGTPLRLRIAIPEGHSMFLKYGVANRSVNLRSKYAPDYWARDSLFDQTGPFETKIESGVHDFEVASRSIENNRKQFRVSVDGKPILVTTFQVDDTSGYSSASQGGDKQHDGYTVDDLVPIGRYKLTDRRVSPAEAHWFRLWLDPRPSGFDAFPPAEAPTQP